MVKAKPADPLGYLAECLQKEQKVVIQAVRARQIFDSRGRLGSRMVRESFAIDWRASTTWRLVSALFPSCVFP